MAILRKIEHMPEVTAQGTMIKFPNAKCRLTMKNKYVFMVFSQERYILLSEFTLNTVNYSPSACS